MLAAVLVISGAVVLATRDPGYPVHRVDAADGSVWVTNDRLGIFGRVSTPARALDAALIPTARGGRTHQLDLVQAGSTVLARDRILGRLTPVDVRTGALLEDRGVSVPAGAAVAAGGGTVAVLDPATGVLRATWGSPQAPAAVDGLDAQAKPVATVAVAPGLAVGARGAAVSVGPDGSILAVGSAGDRVVLRPDSAPGQFSVEHTSFGAALQDVQLTTVGPLPVIVDVIGAAVLLPGGGHATLPSSLRDAVVQHPGPPAAEALLAGPTGLFALDLASGQVRSLTDRGSGTPAAPAVLGSCRYAAWGGSPGLAVRGCADGAIEPIQLERAAALVAPQLRQNRDVLVLNEGVTGGVWELPSGRRLDVWASVAPPATAPTATEQPTGTVVAASEKPPTAVADELAARPGRTSVLHLLDNDLNPSGSVLSIRSVAVTANTAGSLAIAPDGQTVQVDLPPGSAGVSFSYTIDDGKGHQSSAPVRVIARQPTDNAPPQLRPGFVPSVHSVAHQGRLAMPVLSDWRDPDNDPVVLASASLDPAPVPVSADGRVLITAPDQAGTHQIAYEVTDGRANAAGELVIEVLAPDSTTLTAATTEPDVARGEVGRPIHVRPLDNDLAGTDPTTASARLALAGEVVAPEGTTTTTDLESGAVTVTAGAPGTYLLTYTAAYGVAAFARGSIRVDVAAAAGTSAPVAMLDQAVVTEQSPVLIDVLANDIDPTGRLLAVQSASAPPGLAVSVVRGRWLRIVATSPTLDPNPQRIRYTLTNGVSATVQGDVSVLQLPPPAAGTPTAVDDFATVRAGDLVVIPVRDNDTDPTGQSLTLVTSIDAKTTPGTLPVSTTTPGQPTGRAYVSDTLVRYQAPTTTSPTTVAIAYVVQDPDGNRASGTAYVNVVPAPTPERPNQAPAPQTLEGRVVAGDTITITIPTSGVDPDGDSVTLRGLETVPTHGRVLATTPSSVTYQAYPTSAETDEFAYAVLDRFGRVATGTIRIAVLPPGQAQPVAAVDDQVVAKPGATVIVNPVDNDIVTIGDTATVLPLESLNPELGERARLDPDTGTISVTAPDALAPYTLRYAVTGASGDPATATITVRGQTGVNIPPIVRSAFATPAPEAAAVAVDVLATAYDPDGAGQPLTVSQVFGASGAVTAGGLVTVPVLPTAQVVPFEVTDAAGAAALGVIYVPAVGGGGPLVRPDAQIALDLDSSVTVALASLATDAGGRSLMLTTSDRLFASPPGVLAVEAVAKDTLKVSSLKGYVGPAAVSFEVTNGASATDPDGRRALITVPVQVGPETPVLRCPDTEIAVVQGGVSRPISVPELCHVWTARQDTFDSLQFVGRLPGQERGLSVSNADPRRLLVAASGEATADTRADLQISIPGTAAVPATLSVLVLPSAPPTMAPVTLQGVRAGSSATVNIAGYITSQLSDPLRSIVSVTRTSGAAAAYETNGRTTLTVTPAPDAKGRIVLTVTVSDIADTARRDRYGVGTVTVEVLGKPDAPGAPQSAGATLSHEALLSWAVPASNGLPIEGYVVSWPGGTQDCPATPCRITGLDNGTEYQFTVLARNAVGESPASPPSRPILVDAVPPPPTDLRTSDPQDRTLMVSWQPPQVDGSPATKYLVTWPNGSLEVSSTSVLATNLDNSVVTTFQVKASNRTGWGPAASVSGQSAGRPQAPAAPRLAAIEIFDGSRQSVKVSWSPVLPNGPGSTSYAVTRTGEDGNTAVVCQTSATECAAPDVANDGQVHQYRVTASNDVFVSEPGAATPLKAVGRPGSFSDLQAQATGTSKQVALSFTSPPAHDKQLTITCSVGGVACGEWIAPTEPTRFDKTIQAPANGLPAVITLTATNSMAVPSTATVQSDVVYGPLGPTRISDLRSEGPYLAWSVTVDPQGLPASVAVTVKVGPKVVAIYSNMTTGAPYTRTYRRKVGYDTEVVIEATTTRQNPGTPPRTETSESGPATITTGVGTLTVEGSPASTCVPGQPCNDTRVRLLARNLPVSSRITCVIAKPGADVRVQFTTTANGAANYSVPETQFVASTGTTYRFSCDDGVFPDAPVTASWSPP